MDLHNDASWLWSPELTLIEFDHAMDAFAVFKDSLELSIEALKTPIWFLNSVNNVILGEPQHKAHVFVMTSA